MILLSLQRGLAGYTAGTIVQMQTTQELAAIAQNLATSSAGPVTPGNVTTTANSGRVGIAAAGTAVTITNAAFTTECKFCVNLSNLTADTTATSIRVTPQAGAVTFTLNAASTAAVAIDWALLMLGGESPNTTP